MKITTRPVKKFQNPSSKIQLIPTKSTYRPTAVGSLFTAHRSPAEIYAFSAKERDTETGLSYFGSRYYSSDLSIWLSVDPMSGKYPHQSNYAYCSNNPIMVVDPNGDDEYFNEYGFFLGSDNSESNNVRMMTQSDWDFFKTVNEDDMTESISAEFGTAIGSLISESDPSVFSDDAILGVYQHYGLETSRFGINEIKNITEYDGKIDKSNKEYSMAYIRKTRNVYIPVSANRNKNRYDNFYNIQNTFEHEYCHRIDHDTQGENQREINAITFQKCAPSWSYTTEEFKINRNKALKHYSK